jgi:AcrR family transcriptional regulator
MNIDSFFSGQDTGADARRRIAQTGAMAYRKTARVQEKLADKRIRILEAARGLVGRRGFREATVEDVAEAAGIATGTVYRYFPSKAALFVEIVSRVSEREVGIVAAIARKTSGPPERLREAIDAFAERALSNRRLAYALIVEPTDPEVEAVRLRYRRKLADAFAEIIADGVSAKLFPPQDTGVAATCEGGGRRGDAGRRDQAILRPCHRDRRRAGAYGAPAGSHHGLT